MADTSLQFGQAQASNPPRCIIIQAKLGRTKASNAAMQLVMESFSAGTSDLDQLVIFVV